VRFPAAPHIGQRPPVHTHVAPPEVTRRTIGRGPGWSLSTARAQMGERQSHLQLQARTVTATTGNYLQHRVRPRHGPVLAHLAAAKIVEHRVRDVRAQHASTITRSHRTARLYATVRYASSRCGTVPHGYVIDRINGEAIANTDSAKEIRRRAVMENAAQLVSKAVFCCKIYTRDRVSNDDLISTKGT